MFKYGRDGVVRYLCPKALEPTRCSLIRCCHEPGEGTNGTSADRTGGLNFDHERVNLASSLDEMAKPIDWTEVARDLGDIHSAVKNEPGWRPLALFKALLLATWYPFGCEAGGGCGGPSQLPLIWRLLYQQAHPIGQAAFATQ
jgi:hypothetical protein